MYIPYIFVIMNRYLIANNLALKFGKIYFTQFNYKTLTDKTVSVVSVYTR